MRDIYSDIQKYLVVISNFYDSGKIHSYEKMFHKVYSIFIFIHVFISYDCVHKIFILTKNTKTDKAIIKLVFQLNSK